MAIWCARTSPPPCDSRCCVWQDQPRHTDDGIPQTLSFLLCLVGKREFHIFDGDLCIPLTLHAGDAVVFNGNVVHRGAVNEPGSTALFMYFDPRPLKKATWAFNKVWMTDEEYEEFCSRVPEGSRHFVFESAVSLLEVPTLINNAYRDPAYVSNIKHGGSW